MSVCRQLTLRCHYVFSISTGISKLMDIYSWFPSDESTQELLKPHPFFKKVTWIGDSAERPDCPAAQLVEQIELRDPGVDRVSMFFSFQRTRFVLRVPFLFTLYSRSFKKILTRLDIPKITLGIWFILWFRKLSCVRIHNPVPLCCSWALMWTDMPVLCPEDCCVGSLNQYGDAVLGCCWWAIQLWADLADLCVAFVGCGVIALGSTLGPSLGALVAILQQVDRVALWGRVLGLLSGLSTMRSLLV